MTRTKRNKDLKTMLQKETVVVFPDKFHHTLDGLPLFSIMMHDLKDLINDAPKVIKEKVKIPNKPKLDMGRVKLKRKDFGEAFKMTIDPKMFKGNVDLHQHMNT